MILKLLFILSLANSQCNNDEERIKKLNKEISAIYKHDDLIYKRLQLEEKQKLRKDIHKDSSLGDILKVIP